MTLDISGRNELLIGLDNNDIAYMRIPTSEPVMTRFEYLNRGSHEGPIQSLDLARHFPLMLTCSRKDNTVRLWHLFTQ